MPPTSLPAGTRLGSYEIVSALGEGGMGAVYRAHDPKLNRDVAIKVLLPAVANDPDRLARFSREAQILASLNHPNVAHIHGLEDADGVRALVMELVEGPTLADRIAQGAIPLDEAMSIANQIADALEAAHARGIIHRDLKPANIKVRTDATVKVLDFGLAKAMDTSSAASVGATTSPTLSMHATEAGIILGTAAYMSPEQAKGKPVDRHADIWAFGAVMFEMLTGQRAFSGSDISDTLVSVLRDEPDWSALPAGTPPSVTQTLRVCLRKDPKQRVGDISAVRLAMEGAFDSAPLPSPAPSHPPAPSLRGLPLAAGAALAVGIVVGAVTWLATRPEPQPPPSVTRFAIVPPAAQAIGISGLDRDLAITPDGTAIVYRAGAAGGGQVPAQLIVRRLDQLAAQPITNAAAARNPIVSPDGRWIAFFDRGDLKKVSITGGPAITLCKTLGASRGASWGDDDTIIFATPDTTTGLSSVPARGGEPKVLTKPDTSQREMDHVFPSILPGARAVLFTITSAQAEDAQIAVLDLHSGERKTLVRGGSHAQYVETGHLVYAAAGSLRAVRFDLARLDTVGDPVPVVEHVAMGNTGAADFAISRHGTLVYVPGDVAAPTERRLVWVDRKGREVPITAPPRPYVMPRLSPDGTRLVLDIRDQDFDIWTWDLVRQTLTRVTVDPTLDQQPVWTPDSRRIVFSSNRGGVSNVFWRAADGTGPDYRLARGMNAQAPSAVTPDGTQVIAHQISARTNFDIVQFALSKAIRSPNGEPAEPDQGASDPLVQTQFNEFNAEISPDGRYIAYQSDESGQFEVYVRPYPKVNDGRWPVSSGGGTRPAWARTGRELFYMDAANTLTAVPVQMTAATFTAGSPVKVFEAKYATPVAYRTYDVSPDGQRFLMIKEASTDKVQSPSLVVVEHWFEELQRLLPAK